MNWSVPSTGFLILTSQLERFPVPIIGGKDCPSVTETPAHGAVFNLCQNLKVTALHTPCHTEDSICFFVEDGDERVVFTGDTLFHGGMLSGWTTTAKPKGCGRFFEGSPEKMDKALNEVLGSLPDDTKVYVRCFSAGFSNKNSLGTSTLKTMPASLCLCIRINHSKTSSISPLPTPKPRESSPSATKRLAQNSNEKDLTWQKHNLFMRINVCSRPTSPKLILNRKRHSKARSRSQRR
jgi:hypothetical protein